GAPSAEADCLAAVAAVRDLGAVTAGAPGNGTAVGEGAPSAEADRLATVAGVAESGTVTACTPRDAGVGHDVERSAVVDGHGVLARASGEAITTVSAREGGGVGAVAELQSARVNDGAASVSVVRSQNQSATTQLHQATRAADDHAYGHSIAPIKGQGSVVGDISGDASTRSAIADLKRARANGCAAAVSIGAGQDRRPGPNLGDTARATDRSGKSKRVASIEGKNAIVGDIPSNASTRSTVTELQCSSTDRRTTGVGIVPGQRQRAAAQLYQATGAADDYAYGHSIAPIKGQGPVVGDISSNASTRRAVANLQCSGTDRRTAGVGTVPGQRQRAAAQLHQATGAAGDYAYGHSIAPIKGQGSVVGDISSDTSTRSAIAELQRSSTDRGTARVGVVRGQR